MDIRLADFGNSCFVPEVDQVFEPESETSISPNQNLDIDDHPYDQFLSIDTHKFNLNPEYQTITPKSSSSSLRSKLSIVPGTPKSPNGHQLSDGLGRGTQAYTAPEIYLHDALYSFPSDIYSLGVILFTLISGNEPFCSAKTTHMLNIGIKRGFFESGMQRMNGDDANDSTWMFLNGEKVPFAIEVIVRSMVSKDAKKRPTAKECVDMLTQYI